MSNTVICPECKGNGYIGNSKDESQQNNCTQCNSQGEIIITDTTIWSTLQFNIGDKQ